MLKSVLTAALACAAAASVASAAAVTFTNVNVDATSVIFSAGGNASSASMGGTDAVLAAQFGAATGRVLTLSASGNVSCTTGIWNGADGGCLGLSTSLSPVNDLSGIQASGDAMFLMGVFLQDVLPSSAPVSSVYSAGSYSNSSFSPLLGQVFFIGDGMTGTGSGVPQTFIVPNGATRLYLGFGDGFAFTGNPGYYYDNAGAVTVSGNLTAGVDCGGITGQVATPEPGTYAMLGLGLVALAIRRKRA